VKAKVGKERAMPENDVLQMFRDMFTRIETRLDALQTSIDTKTYDLGAKASANRSDIDAIKRDIDYGARRVTELSENHAALVLEVTALKVKTSNCLTPNQCQANQVACRGATDKNKEWSLKIIHGLIAFAGLVIAGILAYNTLHGAG